MELRQQPSGVQPTANTAQPPPFLSTLQAAAADVEKAAQQKSSLFDSYELKSFQKQLDSAIAGRSWAPSLSSSSSSPSQSGPLPGQKSVLRRAVRKVMKSFRRTSAATASSGASLVGYESSGSAFAAEGRPLMAIPEGRESSPMLRKALSERFASRCQMFR